jgi:hypothetical protein
MATSKSNNPGAEGSRSAQDNPSLNQAIGRETRAASDALHGAKDQVRAKVAELGADVQQAAVEQAGSLQKRVAETIQSYAEAADVAGKAFADKDSARTARLIQSAASALRDFAGSLSNKPMADVVEDLRSYGRAHPALLVGGAMLAGVALGRLTRSSPVEGQSRLEGRPRPNAQHRGSSGEFDQSMRDNGGFPGDQR